MSWLYWLVAAVSIAGVISNIHGQRICFVLWAISSATWTIADLSHDLPQQAAVQAVYFLLSVYGLIRWRRHGPPAAAMSDTALVVE